MMFNALFVLTVLPACAFALPTQHGHVHRRDHRLIKRASSIWSTISGITGAVDLSLDAFNPRNLLSSAKPIFDKAPDGSDALRVHFKKGSYDYHTPNSGLSFYANPTDLSDAKEVTFTYSLYFPEGFDFVKGGKLPGLYGGNDPDSSISCSGGRRSDKCWSCRYMFRTDGKGELYCYLPQPDQPQFSGNKQLCDVPPESDCNDVYGASVARGAWHWKTGDWTTVTQRIKLNDGGKQNGEIEVKADNQTVIDLKGLAMGDGGNHFWGIQMQSFFGGNDKSWGSSTDQDAWFKDFLLKITKRA